MARACSSCGESYPVSTLAEGDLERAFDFSRPWQGLRILCRGCGAVQRTSFGRVALTNRAPFPLPPNLRVMAVVSGGPEVVPFRPHERRGS